MTCITVSGLVLNAIICYFVSGTALAAQWGWGHESHIIISVAMGRGSEDQMKDFQNFSSNMGFQLLISQWQGFFESCCCCCPESTIWAMRLRVASCRVRDGMSLPPWGIAILKGDKPPRRTQEELWRRPIEVQEQLLKNPLKFFMPPVVQLVSMIQKIYEVRYTELSEVERKLDMANDQLEALGASDHPHSREHKVARRKVRRMEAELKDVTDDIKMYDHLLKIAASTMHQAEEGEHDNETVRKELLGDADSVDILQSNPMFGAMLAGGTAHLGFEELDLVGSYLSSARTHLGQGSGNTATSPGAQAETSHAGQSRKSQAGRRSEPRRHQSRFEIVSAPTHENVSRSQRPQVNNSRPMDPYLLSSDHEGSPLLRQPPTQTMSRAPAKPRSSRS